MLYNLPTGKTIYLTIEEYLNLTDQDIQELIALNFGDYINPYERSLASDPDLSRVDPTLIDIELFPLEDREDSNPDFDGLFDDDYIDFSDPYDI
jgi:hypothetical protein